MGLAEACIQSWGLKAWRSAWKAKIWRNITSRFKPVNVLNMSLLLIHVVHINE